MPRRTHFIVLVASLLLSACSTAVDSDAARTSHVRVPAEHTTVHHGTADLELAVAASRALYRASPAVVLAADGEHDRQAEAASVAVRLGVPMLLTPGAGAPSGNGEAVRTEVRRLAPATVVAFGKSATRWAKEIENGPEVVPAPPDRARLRDVIDSRLPEIRRAAGLRSLLVLVSEEDTATATTGKAAGARVLHVDYHDPRADRDVIAALHRDRPDKVMALGTEFGSVTQLEYRLDVATTGVELPGGGQRVYPGRRMIALYGHPGDGGLGVLGEQSVDAAVARAKRVAGEYQDLVDEPVVPAFEIITTVASAEAGPDGDYSRESPVSKLRPWVDAAADAGMYVMLDLQPGRTDFLTQAKRYEQLLAEPHVGLALDPEWRLRPGQRHMVQIGSVDAGEINDVVDWLAELTRERALPQKLLMLHQFQLSMISGRDRIDTGRDELAVLIHADGFGVPGEKLNTWRNLKAEEPAAIWWGWKNFYDEDRPTFTPAQTMELTPSPVFVSYQ
ncbi:MAG: hypothetical protein ACRDTU_01600 [Micromonosporaceae bacterium]